MSVWKVMRLGAIPDASISANTASARFMSPFWTHLQQPKPANTQMHKYKMHNSQCQRIQPQGSCSFAAPHCNFALPFAFAICNRHFGHCNRHSVDWSTLRAIEQCMWCRTSVTSLSMWVSTWIGAWRAKACAFLSSKRMCKKKKKFGQPQLQQQHCWLQLQLQQQTIFLTTTTAPNNIVDRNSNFKNKQYFDHSYNNKQHCWRSQPSPVG